MADDDKVEEVAEKFKSPLGVTSDDEGDSKVRVCVVIPGLKKKLLSSMAANATVSCKIETRSLDLQVAMSTSGAGKDRRETIRYLVRKFPDDVDPERSGWKVKNDQVIITLYKAAPRSWARELSEVGLETYVDEKEGKDAYE